MTTEEWLESFNGKIAAAKVGSLGMAHDCYAEDVPALIQEVRFWKDLAIRTAKAFVKETRND